MFNVINSFVYLILMHLYQVYKTKRFLKTHIQDCYGCINLFREILRELNFCLSAHEDFRSKKPTSHPPSFMFFHKLLTFKKKRHMWNVFCSSSIPLSRLPTKPRCKSRFSTWRVYNYNNILVAYLSYFHSSLFLPNLFKFLLLPPISFLITSSSIQF